MRRRAFTLIELLVVISIILVLTGLVLAGVGVLRESAKRGRTEAILAATLQGISTWSADQGGLPSPGEHPLAGSREPRSIFVRASGGTVAVNLMAFVGVEETNLPPGYRSRLLLSDDRFADPAAPGLFGLSRDRIGILGAGIAEVTRFKLLPTPTSMAAVIASPDDAGVGRTTQPTDGPSATDRLLTTILGKGGHFDELTKMGAVWSPPDDLPAHRGWNTRVWSITKAAIVVPGTASMTDPDGLQRYRLRGPGIYDAWGNEVLVSVASDGRNLRLMSAGRDGHFAWLPGADGSFQTDPTSASASGDDRDAARDNVIIGGR